MNNFTRRPAAIQYHGILCKKSLRLRHFVKIGRYDSEQTYITTLSHYIMVTCAKAHARGVKFENVGTSVGSRIELVVL